MKKSRRLTPIIKVSKAREYDAARTLGEHRRIHDGHEDRLVELCAYHEDYSRRLVELGNKGADVAKINEYRRFIHKLDEAIVFQRKLVESAAREVEGRNQAWIESRVKHKAIDKVATRRREYEKREENRKEQLESDDRAQHGRSFDKRDDISG